MVPPGDGWASDPFEPVIDDGLLTGRGANDMKSAIAAFVRRLPLHSAGQRDALAADYRRRGRLCHLTARRGSSIGWNERDIRPDMILIGEPTSVDRLGDTIKIGRRGSVNMWIDVPGTQGHVAYPHRADNPVPNWRG